MTKPSPRRLRALLFVSFLGRAVRVAVLGTPLTIVQACSSPAGSGGSDGGSEGSSAAKDTGAPYDSRGGGGQAGTGGGGGAGGGGGQGGGLGGQGGAGGEAGTGGDGGGGGQVAPDSDGSTKERDAVAPAEGGEAGSACPTLALSDNFDSTTDTVGQAPSSSLWSLIGTAGCSGTGNPGAPVIYPVVVDGTEHHSGVHSVKITGGDACGPLMLNTSALSTLAGSDVYGRFYVYLPTTNPVTFDHTTLAAVGLTATLNTQTQSSYLQLASEGAGNPTNVFMWQTTDGDILPDKNAAGGATSVYPAPSTWTCVEFHTSTAGALETWVNSTPVAGLTFIPGTTAASSTNNQWTASPFSPTSFGLGWIVFSGPMTSLWFDDVALSAHRIGCDCSE